MKSTYVKPQIIVRTTRVKNYILSASKPTKTAEPRGRWEDMLTKDRNASDEIWNSSSSNEESIW